MPEDQKNKNEMRVFLVLLGLLILTAGPVFATEPLILEDTKGIYSLRPHLDVLVDPEHLWDIERVSSPDFSSHFVSGQQNGLLFGKGISSAWVRFTVENKTKNTREWVLMDPAIFHDQIDLFIRGKDATWTVQTTGDQFPVNQQDFKHRQYVFRLPIEAGATQTFYARFVVTTDRWSVGLNLWSLEAFSERDREYQIGFGFYFVLISVMVLYNFILFFILRDWNYFYYALSMTSVGLIGAIQFGFAREYLWPDSAPTSIGALVLMIGIWGLSHGKFMQSLLLTHIHTPRLHKLISVWMGLSILITISPFFNLHKPLLLSGMINRYVASYHFLNMLVGILCWRRGYRPARYFLAGGLVYACGGLLFSLSNLGWISGGFLTRLGVQWGSALEAVLFSLGLPDRITLLREQKEAQEAELQTAHNMQMGLMPMEAPQVKGFDISGRCIPASHAQNTEPLYCIDL